MVEAVTRYSTAMYKTFVWFHFFKGKRYKVKKLAFLVLFPLIAMVEFLLYASRDPLYCLIMVCIIMVPYFFILAILFLTPIWYAKKTAFLFDTETTYTFDYEQVSVVQQGAQYNGTGTFLYSMLYKVYETDTIFYIYISSNQAYLLPKNAFVKGSPDELRELLAEKLDKKKLIAC